MKQHNILLTKGQFHRLLLVPVFATAIGLATALPSAALQLQETYYSASGCGGVDTPTVNAAFEMRVVELVNRERANNGVMPPLKRVDALDRAARHHATDLGIDDYFDHDSYDRNNGGLAFVCGAFDRIGIWYTDWRRAGENIGAGYATPEEVVAAWMDGEGHRRNILNPNYTEIGVGYFAGAGAYRAYWVQDFGTRNGVYNLVIDDEAAVTEDRNVALYLQGSWSEMRLRNDDGAWGSWRPFASRVAWTLNPGAGEHAVHVELRTSTTRSQASDTIQLNEVALVPSDGGYRVFLPAVVTDPSAARSSTAGEVSSGVLSHIP